MTHIGPLGYDPDWYDNGPGSESFKRSVRNSQKEWEEKGFKKMQLIQECLEWYWFWDDANDVASIYFDEDSECQMTDEGFDELDSIIENAWNNFDKIAKQLRNF